MHAAHLGQLGTRPPASRQNQLNRQDAHFQLVRRTATRQNKTAQNIFASSPPSTRQPWLLDALDSLFDWFSLLLFLFFIYSLASFLSSRKFRLEPSPGIPAPASPSRTLLLQRPELSSLAAHPRTIAPPTDLESRRNPSNKANVLRSRDWQPFIGTMDKPACRVVYVHRNVDKDGLVPAKPSRRDATAAPEPEQALAEITSPAINEDLKPLLGTFGQGTLPSFTSTDAIEPACTAADGPVWWSRHPSLINSHLNSPRSILGRRLPQRRL